MNLRDLASEECTGTVEPVRVDVPALTLPPRLITQLPQPARRDLPPELERHLFPKDGDYRFTEKVLPAAVAKVDAIRDQAIALGWSERRLYQNRGEFRFPCGEEYGLVCFIGEAQRIGDVARQYIEIIAPPPRENRLRFYNPDVPQPWRVIRMSPSVDVRGLSPVTD